VSTGRHRSSLRTRRVVRELRHRRESLGWTLDQAAERSLISPATISRTESGAGLRPANVVALLTAYGATPAEIQTLLELTKQAHRPGWWTSVDDAVMSPTYRDLAEYEAEADWKRTFDPLAIPTLLQTQRYAETAIAVTEPQLSVDQRAEKVAIRMKRQERLGELWLQAIVLEEVLRRPVGDSSLMDEQLARLEEESHNGRAEVRVLPIAAGMHPGVMGGFSFLGGFMPVDVVAVYVDNASGEACFEDHATVHRIQRRYEQLEEMALSPDDTLQLVAQIRGTFDRADPGASPSVGQGVGADARV